MLDAPDIRVIGEAQSGAAAIEQIIDRQPDVVLMDISMPEMDGLEALTQINEAQLPTRVIMVTTYRNTSYLLQALAKGAAGFILKDVSQEALLTTVRNVAGGTSQVDQNFLESVLRDLNTAPPDQVAVPQLPAPLTAREMDVLRLMVEGLTNQAIAESLIISPSTVKGYMHTLFQKLGVTDRTQAAVKAIRLGLVK